MLLQDVDTWGRSFQIYLLSGFRGDGWRWSPHSLIRLLLVHFAKLVLYRYPFHYLTCLDGCFRLLIGWERPSVSRLIDDFTAVVVASSCQPIVPIYLFCWDFRLDRNTLLLQHLVSFSFVMAKHRSRWFKFLLLIVLLAFGSRFELTPLGTRWS